VLSTCILDNPPRFSRLEINGFYIDTSSGTIFDRISTRPVTIKLSWRLDPQALSVGEPVRLAIFNVTMRLDRFNSRSWPEYTCPSPSVSCRTDSGSFSCCPVGPFSSGSSNEGDVNVGAPVRPTTTTSSVTMEKRDIMETPCTEESSITSDYYYGSVTSMAGTESTQTVTESPNTSLSVVANAGDWLFSSATASPTIPADNTDEGSANSLSQPMIVGIGLGVSVALLASVLVAFFIIRRQGLLRRWRSSQQGHGHGYDNAYGDKPALSTVPARSNHASDDVFAPFGGMLFIMLKYL
jgi:hypothetical protein